MTNSNNNRLVIASRGSKLALRQSEIISDLVRAAHPGIEIEVRKVTTTGDRDARPFAEIGGKGLFTSEVEREIVEGRADVAVHSAKDLTAGLHEGCTLVCVPPRASVADVVVGSTGATGEERLGRLADGARVGTSSIRRRALLAEARPDLEVVPFRGNLDTRLKKVAAGEVDAAILAHAGMQRLGGPETDAAPLDPARWIPAPAQGALAVEALIERDDLADLFVGLGDPAAAAEVACERAFSARLEGGCSIPLGCLARADSGHLVVTGYLGDPYGGQSMRDRISGSIDEPEALGRELAEAILSSGGDEILADLLETEPPQPAPP
ncbi:MAG: hydroxymethylbilane synthase [Actinomycetota bacterium]|nr:hydroxymethylbilane synthase [Actinomycetota bacterium]